MTGEEPDPQYHWEETMIHLVLEVILLSMANTTTINPVTPMNQGRDPTVSSALLAAE